jgi:hypothetical protein
MTPRIPRYPRRRVTFTPAALFVVLGLAVALGLFSGLLIGEILL